MSEIEGTSDAVSVSETLQRARTTAGLSQEEIADALFLTSNMIELLDAGEFDRLPNQAFVRGYLRSYARMVGLDPNQVIRQFDEERRQAEPLESDQAAPKSVVEPRFSGVVRAGLISLGLIVVLVFAVLLFSSEETSDSQFSQETNQTSLLPAGSVSGSQDEGLQAKVETGPVGENDAEALKSESNVTSQLSAPAMLGATEVRQFDALSPVSTELAPSSRNENEDLLPEAPSGTTASPALLEDGEAEPEAIMQSEDTSAVDSDQSLSPSDASVASSSYDGNVTTIGLADIAAVELLDNDNALMDEGVRGEPDAETSRFGLDSRPGSLESVSISREVFDGGRRIWVDAGGDDELTAELTDECWIEVADGQGDLIYGDLNKAGDALIIKGFAPFVVLLGKAPVVSLAFNGEPVDLAGKTTRELTARLTLGN